MVFVKIKMTRGDEERVGEREFGRIPAIGEVVEIEDELWTVDRLVHTPEALWEKRPPVHDPNAPGGKREQASGPSLAVIWVSRPEG